MSKILLVSCAHSLDLRYCEFVRKYHIDRLTMKYYISISFLILDIDECLDRSHACDVTANCTNTDGSHNCTCKEGYTGDGHSCQGIIITLDLANSRMKFSTNKNKTLSLKTQKFDVCLCQVMFWQFMFVLRRQ